MLTLDLKGLPQLLSNLEKMNDTIKKEVSATLELGARMYVRNAKRDAPVDHGRLRNSISYYPAAPLSFNVVCAVDYAAYLEWGTITRVHIPAEEVAIAAEFKGRGIRKNGGIFPHPFFFKQQPVIKAQIEKGIEDLLNDLAL